MTRTDAYAAYTVAATAADVRVLKASSFNNIAAIVAATDAANAIVAARVVVAEPVKAARTLQAVPLSGEMGYIHDKLAPHHRARARRWWRSLGVVDHALRGRWMASLVPVELCAAIGVTCHKKPRG